MSISAVPRIPHSPQMYEGQRATSPLFAGLLTLIFGWGLGHFYLRQTRTALWLTGAQLLAALAMFGALYWASTQGIIPPAQPLDSQSLFSGSIHIRLSICNLPFAVWAWLAARKQTYVELGGAWRVLGYLGLWLAPPAIMLAISMSTGLGGWNYDLQTGQFE